MTARIAILGATGHIGRAISDAYLARGQCELALFSRRPDETAKIHAGLSNVTHHDIQTLDLTNADIVVNAIGIGNPANVPVLNRNIYDLTMTFEDAIDRALKNNPECLTVFVSSGAIYGKLTEPAHADTFATHAINSVSPSDWYALSKLSAELRHRAQPERRIVDIRVFGFLSPHLDLRANYFMSEVYRCMLSGTTFLTPQNDMHRDYIGAEEFLAIVDAATDQRRINTPIDAYTTSPAGKFEILHQLEKLGLKWEMTAGNDLPVQDRVWYSSGWPKAAELGYSPTRSSIDVIESVAHALLEAR